MGKGYESLISSVSYIADAGIIAATRPNNRGGGKKGIFSEGAMRRAQKVAASNAATPTTDDEFDR